MTLPALRLFKRPLADLAMTGHALAVERIHASGDKRLRLLAVADGAIGRQRIQLHQPFGRKAIPHLDHSMAGSAALGSRREQVFMAGEALLMHGVGQRRRRALLPGLPAGSYAAFVAIGAVLRFGFDVR